MRQPQIGTIVTAVVCTIAGISARPAGSVGSTDAAAVTIHWRMLDGRLIVGIGNWGVLVTASVACYTTVIVR